MQETLQGIQDDLQKLQVSAPAANTKQQHLQGSVQPTQQVMAKAAGATNKPQPSQQRQTSSALLVIEAFAGSHAAGLHFKSLLDKQTSPQQPQQPHYHLAAYAAIELEPRYKAPDWKALNLQADNCLSIHASVSDFAVQAKVLDFVRSKLCDSSLCISAVVVFGGPPCTAYSQARPHLATSKLQLEESYQQALLDHTAQQRQLLAAGSTPSAAATKAQKTAAETASRIQDAIEAAAAEAAQHARNLKASDSLVKSFLSLFKAIEVECQEYGKRHCYLVMENPYSQPDRALWNR
jgi:hypothetical protein